MFGINVVLMLLRMQRVLYVNMCVTGQHEVCLFRSLSINIIEIKRSLRDLEAYFYIRTV